MRSIGVISGKGGVGKTTVVANLGLALTRLNKSVTVIDCNVTTSHLGLSLGLYDYPKTLNNVLRNEAGISDATYFYNGLKIIPASLELEELINIDMEHLNSFIRNLSDTEIVLLDSSPGLGKEALGVLKSCDEVIFVTTPYMIAISDVIRCNRLVSELGIKPLGIVLNMITNDFHELTASNIEMLTKLPVISKIPFDKNVQRGLAMGNPIMLSNPYSPVSREISKLASSISGENYRQGSFFSRFYYTFKNLWG